MKNKTSNVSHKWKTQIYWTNFIRWQIKNQENIWIVFCFKWERKQSDFSRANIIYIIKNKILKAGLSKDLKNFEDKLSETKERS